jgi:tetratricopeptide (TPR) repeat protein
MEIRRTLPRRSRQGPSCLLVLLVIAVLAAGIFIISNVSTVRESIIPEPTPLPTRSAASFAARAALMERDGDYQEAIEAYEEAIRNDGSRVEFYLPLIDLLLATTQPEEGLKWAEQAVVLAPENNAVWSALAAAYLASGIRLEEIGDPAGAALAYAEAVRAARSSIDINPSNAVAFATVAGALAQLGPEQYANAQEAAEIALSLDPDNPIVRQHMATVLEFQGFYSAAIEQYQLAIDQNPNVIDLHIGLAYNYYATRDIPTAILTFQDALDIDPENAAVYDGLGWMFFLIGEYPSAEENLIKAVDLDPEMVRAHAHLGAAYYRNLNYDNAIPELETAVERYGSVTVANSTYFNMLGLAYYFKGEQNCDLAVALFETVLDTVPDDANALEGMELCRAASLETEP